MRQYYGAAVIVTRDINASVHPVHLINVKRRKRLLAFSSRQPIRSVSPRGGCYRIHSPSSFIVITIITITIITQPESWSADTNFTVPRRVDGWVSLHRHCSIGCIACAQGCIPVVYTRYKHKTAVYGEFRSLYHAPHASGMLPLA